MEITQGFESYLFELALIGFPRRWWVNPQHLIRVIGVIRG